MRFSLSTVPALAALAAALPAPVPQDIDLDMVAAVPDPTYSEAVGVTAQVVTLDATAIAAQATNAVSSISVEVSDVLSSTAIVKRNNAKRTACAPQPTGVATYAVNSPDTASAFGANAAFSSLAAAAPTPSGYTNTFTNLNASNNAYGYMGFTTLSTYDTNLCAAKCNAINGCMSFNLYFERDPSVDPGNGASGCANPASVTMVKCVFWGGPVSSTNANNYGQYRNQFQVVVAGSNGYTNSSLIVPSGYTSAVYAGNAAINAPYDAQGFNTFMGSTIFNNGPFNASLCAAYCDGQSAWNRANPAKDGTPPKICRFFNTYLLYLNTTAHMQGQYCSLYTEAWDSSYATNVGQYRGSDHYVVEYSYTFTNASDAGVKPTVGDKQGAIYQAALDMKYDTQSLTSTFLPFCSSVLSYAIPTVTATVTSTPVSTVYVSQTTTVTGGNKKRAASSLSVPAVLTKYPSTVVASACSLVATSPASTLSVVVTTTATASTSLTSVTSVATVTATPKSPYISSPACPNANNQYYKDASGTVYRISCYRDYSAYDLGQASNWGSTFSDCMAVCDGLSNCVGVSWHASGECYPKYQKLASPEDKSSDASEISSAFKASSAEVAALESGSKKFNLQVANAGTPNGYYMFKNGGYSLTSSTSSSVWGQFTLNSDGFLIEQPNGYMVTFTSTASPSSTRWGGMYWWGTSTEDKRMNLKCTYGTDYVLKCNYVLIDGESYPSTFKWNGCSNGVCNSAAGAVTSDPSVSSMDLIVVPV